MKKQIEDLAQRHGSFAIQARERLHMQPELSNQEFETSAFIQQCLAEAQIEYTPVPGMTGVIGIVRGAHPGQTVALRADMDALPIQEQSQKPYCSRVPGVMHACGHDVHTAILLGTARMLQDMRHQLRGNVKFFFQPAEETTGGAQRMVAAGCMENPPVDRVFALHVDAALPCGTLRTKAGAFNAASDTYKIVIQGKKAHGAEPHLGQDALVAAASLVLALQTIISRRVSPQDSAVVTVGTLVAGTAENVIADRAELSVMVRTTDKEVRRRIHEGIGSIITHTCAMHEVAADVSLSRGYDTLYNDGACVEMVRRASRLMLGEDAFQFVEHPFMGSEDFCYYCADVPGAMYQLGSRNEALGITGATHSATYDADPQTVVTGMKMQAAIVLGILGDPSSLHE